MAPCKASTKGRTSNKKVTKLETGLPGKPMKCALETPSSRRIDPKADRLRRLPFAFAHIEMIGMAGGSPPINSGHSFASGERTILPEIFTRTGAPAAMQTDADIG